MCVFQRDSFSVPPFTSDYVLGSCLTLVRVEGVFYEDLLQSPPSQLGNVGPWKQGLGRRGQVLMRPSWSKHGCPLEEDVDMEAGARWRRRMAGGGQWWRVLTTPARAPGTPPALTSAWKNLQGAGFHCSAPQGVTPPCGSRRKRTPSPWRALVSRERLPRLRGHSSCFKTPCLPQTPRLCFAPPGCSAPRTGF